MAILVRLWGQVAMVSPGTRRQLIDSREASNIAEAKSYAEEFRLAVVNRKMTWPVNVGVSHIDFGFKNERDARAHALSKKSGSEGLGRYDVFPMGDGIYSTVEHNF